MAKLKTINAYLFEIKRLHLAGHSQATAILAKLLAKLEQNVKQAGLNAMFFSRNFSAGPNNDQPLYDEFSGLWIAFARHYHSIAFNVNDTLQEDFQNIWVSYTEDFGAFVPAICEADFFRKCLIAAELFRRKQYGDYVKGVLAGDDRILKNQTIKSLPSFPLPSDLLPEITNKLFNYLLSNDVFSDSIQDVSTSLSFLSVKCGNIQDLVDRGFRVHDLHKRRKIGEFLKIQQNIDGGIRLSPEEEQRILSSHQNRRALGDINLFSWPTKTLNQDELETILALINNDDTTELKKAYQKLTPDQVPATLQPLVITHLTDAAKNPNETIQYLARIALLTFSPNQVAYQLHITNLSSIIDMCGSILNQAHMSIVFEKTLTQPWDFSSTEALSTITTLINHADEKMKDLFESHSNQWSCVTSFVRLLKKLTGSYVLPNEMRENITYTLLNCLTFTLRESKEIIKLIEKITPNSIKNEVIEDLSTRLLLGYNESHKHYAHTIDKLSSTSFNERADIVKAFIHHVETTINGYTLERMTEVLLALTLSLPLEQKIQMTSLFSDLLGTRALLVNDCVYRKQEIAEWKQYINNADLPKEMITYIKQFNL